MLIKTWIPAAACVLALVFHPAAMVAHAADDSRLQICATVPDLGSLATSIGGDQVNVTVFVRGPEDPHFLDAKPSFVKSLSTADLFLFVGLELEVGWAPVLWKQSRNARILPGEPGHVDCSRAIVPCDVAQGTVDRSMGDVHVHGNPHYLLDPVNGLHVAALVRDRLSQLRPLKAAYFDERYGDFKARLGAALFGEKLATRYDPEKLMLLLERGGLDGFLRDQKEESLLGGWLGSVQCYRGTKAVGDHNLWPYFAARFGLNVIAHLEPKPGIAPTTHHLEGVVERMKAESVHLIITVPYFNPRYSRFVAENAGARVVELAHQCGALHGTDEYVAMIDTNVRAVVTALEAGKATP